MSDVDNAYEHRQQDKIRRETYRDAARRLLAPIGDRLAAHYVTVSTKANVAEDADKSGAFVECTIFVPKSEIE